MPFAIGETGTRIHYEEVGTTGPHVVLVQGLGLSSRFWFALPKLLAEDPDERYRVITLDNRGTGKSDKPRGPYTMSKMADDVALVLDAAGVERAFIVGISMGGMIAQHVALRHPARVEGLVLLATSAGLPHGRLPSPSTLLALLRLPFEKAGKKSSLPSLLLTKDALGRAGELLAEWPAALAADRIAPQSFLAQFAAAATHSTGFRLGEITCPTVVVSGTEDVLIPSKNSRILAKRIRGAKLELLEGVGHAIPAMDARVVARSLHDVRKMVVAP